MHHAHREQLCNGYSVACDYVSHGKNSSNNNHNRNTLRQKILLFLNRFLPLLHRICSTIPRHSGAELSENFFPLQWKGGKTKWSNYITSLVSALQARPVCFPPAMD